MEYKYCYGLGIKKLNNPSRFFREHCLFCGESIKHCGITEKHFTNNFDEVLQFFYDENLQGVSLSRTAQNEVDQILNVASAKIKHLELVFCNLDYAQIEKLENVETLEIMHTTKPFCFWSVGQNKHLKSLDVVFHNCKQILKLENLANTNIESLKIKTCNPVPSRYNQTEIGSLKVLSLMPKLKFAEVYVVSKNDKVEELLAFATMQNLESLKLQKGHFSFEQFAWLKSRLQHLKDLNCLCSFKFDDYYGVEAGVIIGKNKPNYYLDYSKKGLDRYVNKYNALVESYKNVELPPNNYK